MTRRFDESQEQYAERLRDEVLRRVHILFRGHDAHAERPWNLKALEDAAREYWDALDEQDEEGA